MGIGNCSILPFAKIPASNGGLTIGSNLGIQSWKQLFDDGSTYMRKVVRMQGVNEIYSVDVRLTESPGFNGVENIDFVSIYSNEIWTQDLFDRANGAVGNDWVGSTWSIVDGKVINTPVLGNEKLTNGTFEGAYTAGLAPSWTKTGTPTVTEEVGIAGSKAQGITGGDNANNLVERSVLFVSNTWYKLDGWAKLVSGTTAYFRLLSGLIGTSTDVLKVINANFAEYIYTFRSILDNYANLRLYAPAGSVCAYDNISIKPLTTTELFLSRDCSYVDKLRVSTEINLFGRAEGGIFMCLDSAANPLNYVYAIARNNTEFKSGDISLYKCVAGVHSLLKTGAVIILDFRNLEIVRKDKTTFAVYYDNIQVSTDATIADVSIIDNTYIGLFSTHDDIQFKSFEAVHAGVQKQVPSNTLLHTIIVASDIHVGNAIWQAGELDALVAQFNTIDADVNILLGDLTENGLQTEKDTFDASFVNLANTTIEFEGNHDENAGLDLFPHRFVQNIGDFTLIGFHTTFPVGVAPLGAIETDELTWLEAQIIAASGRVILFCHIPIYNVPVGADGIARTYISPGYGQEEAMALCEKYGIKVVYSGHNHLQGEYRVVNDVAYYSGMACISLWGGYQILKFYSDRINLVRYSPITPFTRVGENMGINTWF